MVIRDNYRSSLSQCDPNSYSSIYHVGKHPDFKTKPVAATQPINKDTIQISKDKLQKDALERLRHTSKYTVAQNGFMRIGKYLFLAVTLPPYLLIYKIPKFVLIDTTSFLFSFAASYLEKSTANLKKRIEVIVQKAAQLLHKMQTIGQKLIQPIIYLALEVRNILQRIRQNVAYTFNRIRKGRKEKLSLKKRGAVISNLFGQARKGLSVIGQQFVKQITTLWSPIEEGFQWLKQQSNKLNPQQLFKMKGIKKWITLPKPLVDRFQRSQQMAYRTTEWVAKGANKCKQWVQNQAQRVFASCQKHIQPKFHAVRSLYQSIKDRAKGFFKQKRERFLNWLRRRQAKLQDLQAEQVLTSFFAKRFWNWIPKPLYQFLSNLLWKPVMQKVIQRGIHALSFVTTHLLKGVEFVFGLIDHLIGWISQGVNWVLNGVKAIVSQALSFVLGGLAIVEKGFCKGLYHFLVFIFIMIILLIWGAQLVRRIANDFISFQNRRSAQR